MIIMPHRLDADGAFLYYQHRKRHRKGNPMGAPAVELITIKAQSGWLIKAPSPPLHPIQYFTMSNARRRCFPSQSAFRHGGKFLLLSRGRRWKKRTPIHTAASPAAQKPNFMASSIISHSTKTLRPVKDICTLFIRRFMAEGGTLWHFFICVVQVASGFRLMEKWFKVDGCFREMCVWNGGGVALNYSFDMVMSAEGKWPN